VNSANLCQQLEVPFATHAGGAHVVADDCYRDISVCWNHHRAEDAGLDVRAVAADVSNEAEAIGEKNGLLHAPVSWYEGGHAALLCADCVANLLACEHARRLPPGPHSPVAALAQNRSESAMLNRGRNEQTDGLTEIAAGFLGRSATAHDIQGDSPRNKTAALFPDLTGVFDIQRALAGLHGAFISRARRPGHRRLLSPRRPLAAGWQEPEHESAFNGSGQAQARLTNSAFVLFPFHLHFTSTIHELRLVPFTFHLLPAFRDDAAKCRFR
jgi:hypothetical protein